MKITFFNYPVGTQKVVFTAADMTVKQLKDNDVIPKDSVTLVKNFNDEPTIEEQAMLVHTDKLVFDNYDKPKKVEFDLDLVKVFFVNMFKEARLTELSILDNLQMRAMASGRTEVVEQIEADKNVIRSFPDRLDYSKCETFFDVSAIIPEELTVDYQAKYDYILKS